MSSIQSDCQTIQLKKTFSILKSVAPKGKIQQKRTVVELTFKDKQIEFVLPGCKQILAANSSGPAKITCNFYHLFTLVKSFKPEITRFSVAPDWLSVNTFQIQVASCFFPDDKILRSVQIPVNYGIKDILLATKTLTPEEIKFNRLDEKRRLGLVNRVKKQIDKFEIEAEQLEFSKH